MLTVIGTHPVPPAGTEYTGLRNRHLAGIPGFVKKAGTPVLLLGDLNTTPWNHAFRKLLKESGLVNSARGFGIKPTWPSFFWPAMIPLDHCLHSAEVLITGHLVGQNTGSDHYPLVVDFVMPESSG